MSIMRLGYIHMRVTDMAEAKNHYANLLGLYEMKTEGNRVWYKGWDEWDHHSVVLEEGGVGVIKYGFKVEYEEDIAQIENRAKAFGATVERMSAGENPEVGDGIRIHTPSEHVFEVYHSMTTVGVEVGTHNPDAFPRHLVGIGAPCLDHSLLSADDPKLMEKFLIETFDYFTTERVDTSLDDDADTIAVWMTNNNIYHQMAVLKGPQAGIHHFAFRLEDWNEVLHAADLMAIDDVPIDIGPTRHGITRGKTVYFFDPSGNRNEVFAGGLMSHRDRPMVTWTADQVGKGIFYHARELNERFTTVFT
ncbi:MAG: catechol 2,3-dioxygenase [Propionibacteriaceae bacterium]|nr:catechol 2,3-dioxygenase [Propionibacteriaceae bacterium]